MCWTSCKTRNTFNHSYMLTINTYLRSLQRLGYWDALNVPHKGAVLARQRTVTNKFIFESTRDRARLAGCDACTSLQGFLGGMFDDWGIITRKNYKMNVQRPKCDECRCVPLPVSSMGMTKANLKLASDCARVDGCVTGRVDQELRNVVVRGIVQPTQAGPLEAYETLAAWQTFSGSSSVKNRQILLLMLSHSKCLFPRFLCGLY